MNPLQTALNLKTGAEKKIQGFGRFLRKEWDTNTQNIKNAQNPKWNNYSQRNGIKPD